MFLMFYGFKVFYLYRVKFVVGVGLGGIFVLVLIGGIGGCGERLNVV